LFASAQEAASEEAVVEAVDEDSASGADSGDA
jgi:hypothetical protein